MPTTITLQAALVIPTDDGYRVSVPSGTDLAFLDAANLDQAAEQLEGISRGALIANASQFNREDITAGQSSEVTYGPGGEKLSRGQGAPPVLESAVIADAAPTVIVATFDKDLISPGEDFKLGFSCKVATVARVISTAVQQEDLAVIHFTLASAVDEAEAVLLSYNKATGDVESLTGGDLQSFTDTAVTNSVAA